MCKKIVLVLPLVLVLALVVSVSTSAQGKVALSDAQMSSVYGGGRDCEEYGQGCEPPICWGDCTDCEGWRAVGCPDDPNMDDCQRVSTWTTGCLQPQLRCGSLSSSGSDGCSDTTTACTTPTNEAWSCGREQAECECNYIASYNCPGGTRLWCNET